MTSRTSSKSSPSSRSRPLLRSSTLRAAARRAPAEPSAPSAATPSPPPSPASPAERRLSAADEARARQLELLRGNFTFESVGIGGLDKELGQLFRRVLAPRLLPASVRRLHNLGVVRGVLLHGPPGTGKTLTARKIGGLLKVKEERTHVVNGPDLVSKFLGESEANLRGVFDAARSDERRHGANASLHLVIFDEMDAICRPRGHDGGDGGPGLVYDSLVNQLLSILDGVSALDNVLVIGMTNRKDLIDRALLRPGRFEVEIKMPMPTRDGRLAILRIHTNSTARAADVRLAAVAAETAGFTGADIAGVVKSATSAALQRRWRRCRPVKTRSPTAR